MAPGVIALSVWVAVWMGTSVWLYFLRAERNTLQKNLHQSDEDRRKTEAELAQAKSDLAVAENSLKSQREHLENYKQQLPDTFKSAAGDALKQSTEQFLALAKKSFESEQKDATAQLEQRKQAIGELVGPLKDLLTKHQVIVRQIESDRKEAYGGLNNQIKSLIDDQRLLRKETHNLVNALRRPDVRGRWGEIQLKRVVELAGMVNYCDFTEQETLQTDEGRLRPDMTVRLPSDRVIVVDAKTPLEAYLSAVECDQDDQRKGFLEQHASHVEGHVKALAGKQYAAQFNTSPDFVVLFIPGEVFLQAALQVRPSLIESALERGVIIATPSTLIALLKVVAMGWREQRQTENAQKISELGKELHSRIATLLDHILKLRTSLNLTVTHFNNFVGSMESSVLPQARRFEELGADSHKKLPTQIPTIHTIARNPKETAYQPAERTNQDN